MSSVKLSGLQLFEKIPIDIQNLWITKHITWGQFRSNDWVIYNFK